MKHTPTLLLLLLTFLALSQPAAGDEYDKLSLDAKYEFLMQRALQCDEPDTTLFMQRVHALIGEHDRLGEVQKAIDCYRLSLLYCYYCDIYDREAIELEKAIAYQEKRGVWESETYNAWMWLVEGYFSYDNNPVLANVEAKRLLKHAKAKGDKNGLAYAYVAYGILTTYDYVESVNNFKRALKYFNEAGNVKRQIMPLEKASEAAVNNDKWEDLKKFSEQMLQSEMADKIKRQSATARLIVSCWLTGEKERAAKLYEQLRHDWHQGTNITSSNIDVVGQMLVYYACLSGKTDDAIEYIQQIQNPSIKEQLDMYLAVAQHDYKTAYELKTKIDSMELADRTKIIIAGISNANAAFNNEQLKAENQKIEMEHVRTQNQRNIIIIISLCIIMMLPLYFRRLLQRLNKMLKIEKMTSEELREAKMKMDTELGVAKNIQQSMLPKANVGMVHALMMPAKEVGGDFYNYVVADGRLCFVIADVSGKGIPAALFMARATELFSVIAPGETDPANIVSRINNQMCHDNEHHMFITMIVGILDLNGGGLQLCSAGHNPPYIGTTRLSLPKNCPVGVLEDFNYCTHHIEFARDARLTLYTDGVTEAENMVKEQFGEERLEQILANNPLHLCTAIVNAVHDFAGEAEQSDDITVMTVTY